MSEFMRKLSSFFVILFAVICFVSPLTPAQKQKSQETTFFLENQSNAPLLLRDLSATISQNNGFFESEIKVVFHVENRSKKGIDYYEIQEIDKENSCSKTGRMSGGKLQPNESIKIDTTYPADEKWKITYRINYVGFTDGTKWKNQCPASSKAILSKGVSPIKVNVSKTLSMILRREFQTTPFFADKILKVIDKETQTIEELEIKVKKHELKTIRLEMIESCDVEGDGFEIAYNDFDFDIDEILTYEFNDKIFAYEIPYQWISGENGSEIGAGSSSIYVDEKGNGNFKLQCNEKEGIWELKMLPKWIKNLAQN